MGKGSGKGSQDGEPGVMEGFAGTTNGSFFQAPSWVDQEKRPGFTSQLPVIKDNPPVGTLLSGKFLFWSPNLVWLAIALLDYFVFPYDFKVAKTFTAPFLAHMMLRMAVNTFIVFSYFGFWHVTLYWLGWGTRPFKADRGWRWSKVVHNMWYCLLGCLQYTAWEGIFMYCYATGRLPHVTDTEVLTTTKGMLNFVACFFWVPLFREVHFYFAHRFIHIKFLYKYVHSLHHRNTDIEPFSGLCMHPIEHLYYYSCVGPALYVFASPFAFMWLGIHLLISPAASHSGYEDNFQSDQFHYLHHRYFECNYGTGTFPFDMWFGTMRDKLKPVGSTDDGTYKGEFTDAKLKEDADGEVGSTSASAASSHDAKASLLGMPDIDQAIFNAICCVAFPYALWCATIQTNGMHEITLDLGPLHFSNAQLFGALISFGPAVVGLVLIMCTKRNAMKNPYRTIFEPFHKEKLLGAFGLNFVLGFVLSVMPCYHTVTMLLSPPGESVYFKLWGA